MTNEEKHTPIGAEMLRAWLVNDPDEIVASEYRAVYDTLAECLDFAEQGTEHDYADAILEAFIDSATAIRAAILAATEGDNQ